MTATDHAVERLAAVAEGLRREVHRARAAADAARRTEQELRHALKAAETARRATEAERSRLEHLLAGVLGRDDETPAGLAEVEAPHPLAQEDRDDDTVAGASLRAATMRSALRRNQIGVAIHHGTWLKWLREDGLEPAGKKPEAVFLTQLGRCPLVRHAGDAGYYRLDVSLASALRDELRSLHEELRAIPPSDQLSMLGDTRQHRRDLEAKITRVERSAEEAWRTLALETPPGYTPDTADDGGLILAAWLAHKGPRS